MLLCTPKDKAINSIRLAMSCLFQANRGLLAQVLVNKLVGPLRVSDIAGRMLYPSWCRHIDPYQVTNRGVSGKHAFRRAVRHLWAACLDFEAAELPRAALVCLDFSAMIVIDELLTAQDSAPGNFDNFSARRNQRG